MINGKRVVAVTPYGRKWSVSCLLPYIVREHDKGLIDEWHLWMNTQKGGEEDVWYARDVLENQYEWIHCKYMDPAHLEASGSKNLPYQNHIKVFWRQATDPDTVYFRFDDDIVYIHEDTVQRMLETREGRDDCFVAFPTIWNNAVVGWHLQQTGALPKSFGEIAAPYAMDPMAWTNGPFIERAHNHLLDYIEDDNVSELFLPYDMQLPMHMQFSINSFVNEGIEYARLDPPGMVPVDEEHWHSMWRPTQLKRPNILVSNTMVAHFSFYPQRDYLRNQTNVLERYAAQAEKLRLSL